MLRAGNFHRFNDVRQPIRASDDFTILENPV